MTVARLGCVLAAAVLTGCAAYGPPRAGETIHRNVVYADRDGRKLRLDLYVPARPRPAPLVVWMHGGGWKYGHKGFNLQVRDLTREGFAVASVEYRLLGAGRWPAQLDDCRDAAAWLRQNGHTFGIDARRMGFAGESAGGHLAALLGAVEGRGKIRAVCALYPPTDLVAMGERYSAFGRVSVFTQLFGGEIRDRRSAARAASPVTHVSRRSPPFLLYHGDSDALVPLSQSESLHRRLREAGVDSTLHVLPGRGHAFPLDDAQLAEVADFFRRRL
ncbi:MAG: alpha/beta hydrolase [Chthoniobacteraceae bacterium]